MSSTLTTRPPWPPRPVPGINTIGIAVVVLSLLIGGSWSIKEVGINGGALINSFDNALNFIDRMLPLDFPTVGESFAMIFETLAIVFLATLLAVIISIPAAFFAAGQTTSGTGMRIFSRSTIVIARAIPDLILAIVFLRIFGLGPLAGILAMGIHSVGMVGKLYADAIEELNNSPTEAIRSAGGTRSQQIHASILVRLLPQIVATALHRFDINLRTSVLLGYVGVGGIGQEISESLRTLNYQRGMALALMVLALCIFVEILSGVIRAVIMPSGSKANTSQLWADKIIDRIKGLSTGVAAPARSASKEQLTPPWNAARISRFLGVGTIVVLTWTSLWRVDINWPKFFSGITESPTTIALFFPPASGDILESIFRAMVETIQVALAATLLGAILAIPIGILAARNVIVNKLVHGLFRGVIVIIRGLPELILAIIFVVISGLGPAAGTLALAIGAVGLLSKLVADSIEETDYGVQDAIRANGASAPQVFFSATLRQSLPALVAHLMYLFDTNIRSATLLGVVGAGGIGFLLTNASRVNQFEVVTTILISMLAVVLMIEGISIWIRNSVR